METHRGVRRHYHTKHCHATVVSLGRFTATLLTSQAKFSFDTEDTGPAYTHPEISTSDKTHRRLVFPEIPSVLRVCQYPTVCGVCCIAGYELRNSFGRSKWFRDSAGGCRLGKQPKRSAAELDQRRRRAAAPPPPCGCAGPSPGARARKRVVEASARFSSPVVHSLCRSGSPWASVGSG